VEETVNGSTLAKILLLVNSDYGFRPPCHSFRLRPAFAATEATATGGVLVAGFVLQLMGKEGGETIEAVSDLGVTLLLFSIGLKLRVRNLLKPEIWAGTTLHSGIVILLFAPLIYGLAWLDTDLVAQFDKMTFENEELETVIFNYLIEQGCPGPLLPRRIIQWSETAKLKRVRINDPSGRNYLNNKEAAYVEYLIAADKLDDWKAFLGKIKHVPPKQERAEPPANVTARIIEGVFQISRSTIISGMYKGQKNIARLLPFAEHLAKQDPKSYILEEYQDWSRHSRAPNIYDRSLSLAARQDLIIRVLTYRILTHGKKETLAWLDRFEEDTGDLLKIGVDGYYLGNYISILGAFKSDASLQKRLAALELIESFPAIKRNQTKLYSRIHRAKVNRLFSAEEALPLAIEDAEQNHREGWAWLDVTMLFHDLERDDEAASYQGKVLKLVEDRITERTPEASRLRFAFRKLEWDYSSID